MTAVTLALIGIRQADLVFIRQSNRAAEEQCRGSEECAENGLKASVRAAAATEDAVTVAYWQLVLNVLGLLGVGFTVFYAHKAWKESEKSANAALEAFEADNRTWITVRTVEVVRVSVTEGKLNVQVKLEIKNVGAQPAFGIQPNFKAFVTRGGTIGTEARDEVIEFGGKLAGIPNNPGITLLVGEIFNPTWVSDAEVDPHTEKRLESIFAGIERGNRPRVISAAYCVHYRSPASDQWRYSAGVITINMKDHSDFPDNGVIPSDDIRATLISTHTKMI